MSFKSTLDQISEWIYLNKALILHVFKWVLLLLILANCFFLTFLILAQRSDSGAFAQSVVRTNNIDSKSLHTRTIIGIGTLAVFVIAYGILSTHHT